MKLLAGFLLLATPALAQEPAPVAVSAPEANRALVRRYIDEVLSAGKLDLLDELLAPDFADRTPGAPADSRGPGVIREAQQRMRGVFPQVQYTVEDLITEGDKVVARYTVRAATREAEGSPSRNVEITGITIFRIADGKIREAWIINDQIEMFRQLGFTLHPP